MYRIIQLSGLLAFLFSVHCASAQPLLRIWNEEAVQGDVVHLEFRVFNFNDVTRLHIPFFIPGDKLQLQEMDGFQLPGLSSANFTITNQPSGKLVTLDWYAGSDTEGVTVPAGEAVFRFTVKVLEECGIATINIWPGTSVSTVLNPAGEPNIMIDGGSINVTGCLPDRNLALVFSDAYGSPGETVCVQVAAENFENMLAIQYSIEYDANSLALQSISGYNLAGLSNSNFGYNSLPFIWPGSIAHSWTDPDLAGVTIPDGTVMYQLCFNVLPGAADTSWVRLAQDPTLTEAIDGDEAIIKLEGLSGRVITNTQGSGFKVELYDIGSASCAQPDGGSVDVAVSGGQQPYTYQWSGPNGFTATTDDLQNLEAGQYHFTVTDHQGEVRTLTAEVEFDGPILAVSSDTTICPGDVLQFQVQGSPGSTYSWSPATALSCTDCSNPSAAPAENTVYSVTVEDPSGCTETARIDVEVRNYQDFGLLQFSNSPVCNGDTLFLYNNLPGGQSYVWSGPNGYGSINPTPVIYPASGFYNGPYTLSVIDEYGCTAQASFDVDIRVKPFVQVNVLDPACAGDGTWIVDLTVTSDGTSTYTYNWDTGADTQDIQITQPGTFSVTVTSSNGCFSEKTIELTELTEPAPVELTADIVQKPLCPDTADGIVLINTTGGAPPYTFSLSNGTAPEGAGISDLSMGTYVVTATDSRGCMGMTSFVLSPALEQCEIQLASLIGSGETLDWCSQELTGDEPLTISSGSCSPPDPGTLDVEILDGEVCASITGVDEGGGLICWQLCRPDGSCVSLSWQISVGQPGVWPGDTDDNGVADQYDLLPIGLAFGSAGPSRSNAGIEWAEQTGIYWPLATPESLTNFAYIDADGDGAVSAADPAAIRQNWQLEHSFLPGGGPWSEDAREGLSIFVQTNEVVPGQNAVFSIDLGLPNETPLNVYGLAFNLNYDPTWVVPGSAYVTFEGSWLGNNLLTLQRETGAGKIAVALTRTNGQNISGLGAVAYLHFKVKEDAGNEALISFNPSEVRLIDQAETLIPVSVLSTESGIITGVRNPDLKGKLKLYPNPASSVAWLEASPDLQVSQISILDLTGKVIWETYRTNGDFRIQLPGLLAGVYAVRVQTALGAWADRLVVGRN
ncbi:MAG TPA: cohesin domain-containing protein [Flavilitoribacter sp.]|nr:cohesin domain-containing protein [Flavilitoribacter sp.]